MTAILSIAVAYIGVVLGIARALSPKWHPDHGKGFRNEKKGS